VITFGRSARIGDHIAESLIVYYKKPS